MNEEHLIGVFRKALVAARGPDEVSLGLVLSRGNAEDVRFFLDEIARCDALLRDEKRLRALAREVMALK